MTSKNNLIILEGFWGIGKTTIAQDFKKNGFVFTNEPAGPNKKINKEEDIFNWYLQQHRLREEVLKKTSNSVIMERSELSTFAYNYINNKIIPSFKELSFLSKIIKTKKVLLVYLSLPREKSKLIKANKKVHSENILKIIKNTKKINLYEKWYTDILPRKFGIVPLIIKLKNNKRLKTQEMSSIINTCLSVNRVAQINIVICRYNKEKLEILILKRTKNRGGFWQAVTGGVHIGENLSTTASREIKEELSISVTNPTYTGFNYSFMGNDNYVLHEYVYTALISFKKSLEIKISKEHDQYKWVDEKTAIEHLTFNTNKNAIRKAVNTIKLKKAIK